MRRKRRQPPKAKLELMVLQQELRKRDRYTAIRKDKGGAFYLKPVPPPTKHEAMFKAVRVGLPG